MKTRTKLSYSRRHHKLEITDYIKSLGPNHQFYTRSLPRFEISVKQGYCRDIPVFSYISAFFSKCTYLHFSKYLKLGRNYFQLGLILLSLRSYSNNPFFRFCWNRTTNSALYEISSITIISSCGWSTHYIQG